MFRIPGVEAPHRDCLFMRNFRRHMQLERWSWKCLAMLFANWPVFCKVLPVNGFQSHQFPAQRALHANGHRFDPCSAHWPEGFAGRTIRLSPIGLASTPKIVNKWWRPWVSRRRTPGQADWLAKLESYGRFRLIGIRQEEYAKPLYILTTPGRRRLSVNVVAAVVVIVVPGWRRRRCARPTAFVWIGWRNSHGIGK
jgi:hypothetical protein